MKTMFRAVATLCAIVLLGAQAAPHALAVSDWTTYNYINPSGAFQIQFEYPRTEQVVYGPDAYTSLTSNLINLDFARNTSPDLKNFTVEWTHGDGGPASVLGLAFAHSTGVSEATYNGITGLYLDHPIPTEYPELTYINKAFVFTSQGFTFAFVDQNFYQGDVHTHPITQTEWTHMLSTIQVAPYASVDGPMPVPTPITILPSEPAPLTPAMFANGTLVKTADSPVVYRMMDGKRQPFFNEDIFHMWYSDFKDVVIITPTELAHIPIGSPVLPHPWTFIKIQSLPEVYEVQGDGVTLRWLSSESIAQALGGPDWNKKIHDIDITLWQKFEIGAPIDSDSLN